MKFPKIDKDFMEQVRQTQREMKKRNRISYIKDHLFDILNLIIALLALFVAIAGLYLPKSEQPPQVQPDPESQYQAEDYPDDISLQP